MLALVRLWLAATAALIVSVSPVSAAQFDCGQPVSTGNKPKSSDALRVLQVSVGTMQCAICVCDVTGNGTVTAPDALRVLQIAVGIDEPLECDPCGVEVVIGVDGGEVATVDGAITLTIPGGALSGNTTITIHEAPPGSLPDSIDDDGDAVAWILGPAGLELDQAAIVRVRRDDDLIGGSVIGASMTLLVGVDGTDVDLLGNQELTIDKHAGTVTAEARISRLETVGAIPLDLGARITGTPDEAEINLEYPLDVQVIEADSEDVVHTNKARYIDDDFGSWHPGDGDPISMLLTKTDDGLFEGTFQYVCVGPVSVFYSTKIVVTYDVIADIAPQPQDVEHDVLLIDQVDCAQ